MAVILVGLINTGRVHQLGKLKEQPRIHLQEVRNLGEIASSPNTPHSTRAIRYITEKYFMGEPEKISSLMGKPDGRQKLADDLEMLNHTMVRDIEVAGPEIHKLRRKSRSHLKNSIALGIGAFITVCGARIASFLEAGPANASSSVSLLAYSAGAMIMAALFQFLRAEAKDSMLNAVSENIKSVQEFAETAIDFALQEWRASVMGAFKA